MNKKQDVGLVWERFAHNNNLSEKQLEQFKKYYEMVVSSNELFNLTAITTVAEVIAYHFEDSLALGKALDLSKITSIADVGAGAGFPGIPLKIAYPHLELVAIEVTHKKVEFLHQVAEELELDNVEVSSLDWRTFLRKTEYPIDIFCARASLQMNELFRMFRETSPYKNDQLVYWASTKWEPTESEKKFIVSEYSYSVKNKQRKLIFFKKPVKTATEE